MSDISLGNGIGFALGAYLTLAIGGATFLLAMILGLLLPYAAGEPVTTRLFRFVPGPLFCLVVGGACLVMPGVASATFDDWWFACPAVSIVLGCVIAFLNERARRARTPQPRVEMASREVRILVVLIASAFVAAAIFCYAEY